MEKIGQLHALVALAPGRISRYPLDRRLGGAQAGLDAMAKRKVPFPRRVSKPGRPAGYSSLYTDWAIPAL